jgi:tetraacyldisaccharide 4'-kinase
MSTGAARSLRTRLSLWVPQWWEGAGGRAGTLLDVLLAPVEVGYRGVVAMRNAAFDRGWLKTEVAPIPVISVGNISVGGAGKTPFTAWLAGRLAAEGCRPAIVLRGYGRDEVLVHRHLNPQVPVFADRRRVRAVHAAERNGCQVVLLDDGFQHRALSRDLDLLLIAADAWQGSRRMLPRGPWRESLAASRRADLLVVTRKSAGDEEAEMVRRDLRACAPGSPIVRCRIQPTQLAGLHSDEPLPPGTVAGERLLVVAGLAAPASFVTNLEEMGAKLELAMFPDHHEFVPAEAAALTKRADGRRIVMTLKDAVKLRTLLPEDVPAYVLNQEVVIESGAQVLDTAFRGVVQGRCG